MQHFLLPSKDKDNRWQTLLPEELGQNLELHLCKMFKLLLDGNRQGALPSFSLHGAAETQQGKPTQVANINPNHHAYLWSQKPAARARIY